MSQKEYAFRNLVFEGGGMKGIAYVGALRILEQKGILQNIKRVAGTSAGAIIASLLSVGFSIKEIEQILFTSDFSKFKDESSFPLSNVYHFFTSYGWYRGNSFKRWFSDIISQKVSKTTTLAQLSEFKEQKNTRELYLIGADVNKKSEVVFSAESSPNMEIAEALRISMSIPLFYRSVKTKGSVFVDGGIYYNYPIDLFDNEKYLFDKSKGVPSKNHVGKIYNKETLGFRVDSSEEIQEHLTKEQIPEKINSLKEFIGVIISGLIDLANKRHLGDEDWHRTVYIDSLNVKTTQFSLSQEIMKELIKSGEQGALDYFKWFDSSKKEKPLNK